MTSCAQISNNCVVQKPVQNKRVKQIKKKPKKQKTNTKYQYNCMNQENLIYFKS